MINKIVIFTVLVLILVLYLIFYNKYLITKSLKNIKYNNNIIKIKIFDDYKYIKLKANSFHAITVITDINNNNYRKLDISAKKNNINIIPLISYKSTSYYYGFLMKLLLTNEYIKNLPDNNIVMFIDGYDVIINNNQENIINKYYELTNGEKALFSAEKACWPNSLLSYLYPKTSSIYKYLNSGTYISKVKILKKLFINIMKKINIIYYKIYDYKIDDQGCFSDIFLFEHQNLIQLDYNAEIFNCLYDSINDIELKDNIYNKNTKTYPMVFHGNSPGAKHFVLNDIYNFLNIK